MARAVLSGRALSGQEERIAQGHKDDVLTTEEARTKRGRVNRMLEGFRGKPPRIAVERARILTQSMKETEGEPLVLRWAKALERIAREHTVYIGDDELIVGRAGPPGRYSVLYPEYQACWIAEQKDMASRKKQTFSITEEDRRTVNDEIVPYWKGKTLFEAFISAIPEDLKRILVEESDVYTPQRMGAVRYQGGQIGAGVWINDNKKVLTRGFNGIKKEAEEKLAAIDIFDPAHNYDKMHFYQAVAIVCDAIITFAKRHAQLARSKAEKETNPQRKKELLEMAEICEWAPANPARNLREALQALWFTTVFTDFELSIYNHAAPGRIDQYLYPFYKKDKEEGRITDDEVLELLECYWLNMAQTKPAILQAKGIVDFQEGLAHFEHTTLGGQTIDGKDASNELSYLMLQSKKEFPLDYPDLSVRIHSQTPQPFLLKVCELIKEGMGYPKLLNDEEIIPLRIAWGSTLAEARDYVGGGCVETRVINKESDVYQPVGVSLGATLELALNDGKARLKGEQLGAKTGDPRNFKSYEDVWKAFKTQLEYLTKYAMMADYIGSMVRAQKLTFPFISSMYDICMEQGLDIQQGQGKFKNDINLGATDAIGFGTAIDSLAAIKKLVFEDKVVTMKEMIDALDTNFEGKEPLRQLCLNAPKYGNADPYVDSIGHDIEQVRVSVMDHYTNPYGGYTCVRKVPASSHVPLGRVIGATPNGRKAKEPLSEGVSPTQGCDVKGPTATLLSIGSTKIGESVKRAAEVLNVKFSPQAVAGEEGTENLASFIRAWSDQRFWHIQFNIVNRETLLAAQKEPEKYRNLLVRVAGYSAYFVDLSPELQGEIIARTEHDSV